MAYWSLAELLYLTRQELCALAETIEASLPEFEAGTADRLDALTSLDNIRRVMLRRNFHF